MNWLTNSVVVVEVLEVGKEQSYPQNEGYNSMDLTWVFVSFYETWLIVFLHNNTEMLLD